MNHSKPEGKKRFIFIAPLAGILLFAVVLALSSVIVFAEDQKPFLSGVIEQWRPGAETEDMSQGSWNEFKRIPSKTGIQSPFYDVPFAVHVPFEVTFQGGTVRIHYKVSFLDKDLKVLDLLNDYLSADDFGIYRADGTRLSDDSVFWSKYPTEENRQNWRKVPLDASGPLSVWTFPRILRSGEWKTDEFIHIHLETVPHIPFTNPESRPKEETDSGDCFILSPVEPGWYVFWFILNLDSGFWPEREPSLKEVPLIFNVDLLISRGERWVRKEEVAYLYKRGDKPQDMPDEKLFRPLTFEIPVVIRRDAWVFDHAEIKVREKDIESKSYKSKTPPYYEANILGASTQAGATTTLGIQTQLQEQERSGKTKPAGDEKYQWDINFPREIPDYGFGELRAGGGISVSNFDSTEYSEDDFPFTFRWEPSRLDDQPPAGVKSARFGLYHLQVHSTGDNIDRDRKDEALEEFLSTYGQPAKSFWFEDYRERSLGKGPKSGENAFRYLLRGFAPTENRKRIIEDGGTYPVLAYSIGPWDVFAHYKRLKDVEGRYVDITPPSGGGEVVKIKDKFWEWFPGFHTRLKERKAIVEEARADSVLRGIVVQTLRRSNEILLRVVQDEKKSRWEIIWETVVTLGGLEVAETPAQMRERMRQRMQAQGVEIGENLAKIKESSDRANKAYADILADIDKAYQDFELNRKMLSKWKDFFKKQAERLPFELAVASGDYDAFKAAVEASPTLSLSPDTRVYEAQLLLDRSQPVEALRALHDALRIDAEHPPAKRLCAELECSFLKSALSRAHGGIEAARQAFFQYMRERGFKSDDPKNAWLGQVSTSLRHIDSEMAYAAWTTGVTGSLSGLLGKPFAEADSMAATQDYLTTAYIGLQTILRLRMRGHTFSEIRNMTSAKLLAALPLKDPTGRPYTAGQARLLGNAIRQGMMLPDIRALFDENYIELFHAMGKAYFDPNNVSSTWAEWIGDISSPRNLVQPLLPFSVGTAGGRLAGWAMPWTTAGQALVADLRAAQAIGAVRSGTEVIATMLHWDKAVKALGATRTGERLLSIFEKMNATQKGLSTLDKAVWLSAKIISSFILQSVSIKYAEEVGGPMAGLVVEALLVLCGDYDLMHKWLDINKVDPKKLASLARKQLAAYEAARERISGALARKRQISQILDKRKKGLPLTDEEKNELWTQNIKGWEDEIPSGQAAHDREIPIGAAAEGSTHPDPEMGRAPLEAADKLDNEAAEQATEIGDRSQRLQRAADDLDQYVITSPNSGDLSLPKWYNQNDPILTPFHEYRPTHPMVQAADAALWEGEFEKAIQLYQEAIATMTQGHASKIAERRLAFALDVQRTYKPRGPGQTGLGRALSEQEIGDVWSNEQAWSQKELSGGSDSNLYDADDYVIKRFTEGPSPSPDRQPVTVEHMIHMAEAEVLSEALGREIGMDMPALSFRLNVSEQGEGRLEFLYRKAKGMDLSDADAAEIFHHRKQLSSYKAFTEWLWEFDHHAGNYRVDADGRLTIIDMGLADPRGRKTRDYGDYIGKPYDQAKYFLENRGRDVWYNASKVQVGPGNSDPATMLRTFIAEQVITYNDAQETIKKIQALCSDKSRLDRILREAFEKYNRLIQESVDRLKKENKMTPELAERFLRGRLNVDDAVRESIEHLDWRGGNLDRLLKELNQRNYIPLPGELEPPSRIQQDEPFPLAAALRVRHWRMAAAA
jgi:hypothetical protein